MDQTTIEDLIKFLKESLIQQGINVDSIALFGSALRGEIKEGSDIDLIIISPDFMEKDIFERSQMTMKAEIKLQKKFGIPIDILNLTPEEYSESQIKRFYQSKIVA
jgi:uncharacterized protein